MQIGRNRKLANVSAICELCELDLRKVEQCQRWSHKGQEALSLLAKDHAMLLRQVLGMFVEKCMPKYVRSFWAPRRANLMRGALTFASGCNVRGSDVVTRGQHKHWHHWWYGVQIVYACLFAMSSHSLQPCDLEGKSRPFLPHLRDILGIGKYNCVRRAAQG